MPLTTIVDAIWGDSGKGKIADAINEEADLIVKANGGGNAGTTYVIGDKKIILHLLPSGSIEGKALFDGAGNGCQTLSSCAKR